MIMIFMDYPISGRPRWSHGENKRCVCPRSWESVHLVSTRNSGLIYIYRYINDNMYDISKDINETYDNQNILYFNMCILYQWKNIVLYDITFGNQTWLAGKIIHKWWICQQALIDYWRLHGFGFGYTVEISFATRWSPSPASAQGMNFLHRRQATGAMCWPSAQRNHLLSSLPTGERLHRHGKSWFFTGKHTNFHWAGKSA